MTFRQIVRVSRPRFWLYLLGPYLVGTVAGAPTLAALSSPLPGLVALYFLLPANLFVYGINDIFDYETDVRNAKKRGYETLVPPDRRRELARAIALSNVAALPALALLPPEARMALLAFWLLAAFYSAPPIRAKARPFLDTAFNALYLCPGYLGYYLAGGVGFSPTLGAAAWCWAMAMHAYSAVPDIAADRESATPTVATTLGRRGTLTLCLALFAAATALSLPTLGSLAVVLGGVYVAATSLALWSDSDDGVMRLYRFFPGINALCGMSLFFFAALSKPG